VYRISFSNVCRESDMKIIWTKTDPKAFSQNLPLSKVRSIMCSSRGRVSIILYFATYKSQRMEEVNIFVTKEFEVLHFIYIQIGFEKTPYLRKYLFSCQIWCGIYKKNIFLAKKHVCVGVIFLPEI
jgi:hypothetical protein